jgi:DNA recombination protein RmuC
MAIVLLSVLTGMIFLCASFFLIYRYLNQPHQSLKDDLLILKEKLNQLTAQREGMHQLLERQQEKQHAHHLQSLNLIENSLHKNMADVREQLNFSLLQHAELLSKQVQQLSKYVNDQLKAIAGQVDKRLSDSFERTTATFNDVIKCLATIHEAQKKITDLSNNVVSLQEVLVDKQSRGAFGEIQLQDLVRNMLPEANFAFQHTLSNGKRVDCILFLPQPTGHIAIDAKFPLESFRKMLDKTISADKRQKIDQQFKRDVEKHIQDIATKYIIPNETTDGAVMFLPSEAIFAEIHARYSDLVDIAHRRHVWLVSPNTMMAVLTTARAVLKDAATKAQVHVIQKHLVMLGKDFERFQNRMAALAKHIDQANRDVEDVHKSSQKIAGRFQKIEKADLSFTNDRELLQKDVSFPGEISE